MAKFNSKFKKKSSRYMDKPEYDKSMPTGPMGEGEVKDHLSTKSLRDLPKSSYSIKADPYQAILPAATPYDIMGKFLKTVGGNYAGEDNIDGGNVQQYANSSSSKFLKYFDSAKMNITLNYRYLPINYGLKGETDIGVTAGMALVDENLKAMAEATSQLQSTTFTALAVTQFAIKTDLNMGSHARNDGTTQNPYGIYTDTDEVLYALSIYYQTFLQEVLSTLNFHNSFRLKQGTAIRDAWSREVPFLNAFFGLMNKSAFLNLLDSINLSFEGEYVDRDFMEQVNLLTLMPSRRSNSITDPVLEIKADFNRPTIFEVYLKTDVTEDSETGKRSISSSVNPYFDDASLSASILLSGSQERVPVSIWQACSKLKDMLTLEETKAWARSAFTEAGLVTTDTARYNDIKAYFDVIIHSLVQFKPKFSDYRECLDTMTRTGTISWFKGFRPSVTKDTDAPLFQNLIVDDIYKLVMSGADALSYNDITKRWETFSQWNIYSGVPEYDTKQGGAFITFSAKDLTTVSDEGIEYLPIMFNTDKDASKGNSIVTFVSRDGQKAYVTYADVTMSTNTVLSRLVPLNSQSALKIRVPSLAISDNYNNFSSVHFSTLYKTLTQVFGLARIKTTSSGSYDYSLDPDLICIYQIEISDITNAAITYARANAPFRGTTSSQGILGFFGMQRGK